MHALTPHLDSDTWCQLSLATVGDLLGGSENTVRKALGQLVTLELVARQEKAGDRGRYRLPAGVVRHRDGAPTGSEPPPPLMPARRDQPSSATPVASPMAPATRVVRVVLPASQAATGRMRVVRQDGVVVLRVAEDVPFTFVSLPDGRVVPQVGDPARQAPYTVDLE